MSRLYKSWEWVISLRDDFDDATDQDYADTLDLDWKDLVEEGWTIELNLNYGNENDGYYHRFYATLNTDTGELGFGDSWPNDDRELPKKIKKQISDFISK